MSQGLRAVHPARDFVDFVHLPFYRNDLPQVHLDLTHEAVAFNVQLQITVAGRYRIAKVVLAAPDQDALTAHVRPRPQPSRRTTPPPRAKKAPAAAAHHRPKAKKTDIGDYRGGECDDIYRVPKFQFCLVTCEITCAPRAGPATANSTAATKARGARG